MAESGLDALARVEYVRLAWEYALKEADIHQQRLVQLFAIFLTIGLTALASVALEKLPVEPGLAFAIGMFAGAAYAHVRIARLPRRLAHSMRMSQRAMKMFMVRRHE